jgi:hypothetical protein
MEVTYPGIEGGLYRGCWYANAASRVAVEEVELGELTLPSGRPSSRLIFAAPSNATSVTIVAEQISPASWSSFAFDEVYSPEERTLFDLGEMLDYRDQIIRWLPTTPDGAAAMLIPNTTPDRYRFRYGRHSFRAIAFREDGGDTTARIFARIRRSTSGAPSDRMLDLNIFLVGIGVTAANAPRNARLQSALSELQRIYAVRGITVDDIAYYDVSSAAASRLAVIDSASGADSELSQLFQLSEGRSGNAINLFLVREITTSSDGMTLGIAGGIPGPPGVHGSPHSGVAVSFDASVVGADPDRIAQIMAHEMGHFMGLFHVREIDRPCEPGEVPSASVDCAPFGGEDVLSDTTRDSGDNLMWPTIGGADGRTYNVSLSEGQGSVLFNCSLTH